MKTLVLSEVFPPKTGGSGRWLWELYSRWQSDEVTVIAGACDGAEAFDSKQDVSISRVPLTFSSWGIVGVRSLRNYASAYRKVASQVKRKGIDAIHCGRMLPEGLIARMISLRFGVPYAVYVHGEELNTFGTSRELSFLARRVMNGATILITNSRNTSNVLTRVWNVPKTKVEVMNPGVDVQRFIPAASSENVRERLGWKGRRVVLTVGRLQKRKGHAHLIGALPCIIEAAPDVLYAIVGEGEEKSALEKRAKELGVTDHVQFMGEQHEGDLIACMQQCDVFALPNVEVAGDFEGFGMVLVEAQACGRPVLAGRSGGTSETMIEGETGVLVDCGNEDALAASLGSLLRDAARRERMGQMGRRWVEERFDWQRLSARAKNLFAVRFGSSVIEARRAA